MPEKVILTGCCAGTGMKRILHGFVLLVASTLSNPSELRPLTIFLRDEEVCPQSLTSGATSGQDETPRVVFE